MSTCGMQNPLSQTGGGSSCGMQYPQTGGGSRRRRRSTKKLHRKRSGTRKVRGHGRKRSCRCPGGCTRSTCPCYRGRSKPCCTKRCHKRGCKC